MTDDFRGEALDQAAAGVGVLDEIRRAAERQADALERAAEIASAAAGRQITVKGDKGDQGVDGEQGLQGIQGGIGPKGQDGEPGPAGTDGEPGERGLRGFKGDKGNDGERGLQGEPGTDGRTVLNGDGPPSDRRGKNDDWYIDRLAKAIYGPKGPDGWGQPTSLKGPPGQSVTSPGGGGGGGQQVIYDDGVRIGVARDIDFQGGDPVTIDHGIARVPVGSGGGGGGGGPALSNDTPLVESGLGSAGVGTEASRDDHVHPADPAQGPPTAAQVTDDATGRTYLTGPTVDDSLDAVDGAFGYLIGGLTGGTTHAYQVPDTSYDIGTDAAAGFQYYVLFMTGLSAPRTITLPDLFTASPPPLVLVVDASGACSDTNRITVQRAGTDSILNAAAGPAPANSYDLATPFAVLMLQATIQGWLIVAGRQAAFVDPPSATPEALASAFIDAGLMKAA